MRVRLRTYYRTPAGVEIDFIVETRKRQSGTPPHLVAVEVKRADKWDRAWDKPLRDLAAQPELKVERMFGVYTGERSYQFDKVQVLPAADFFKALHRGEVF
jgi:hypothetical protein